MGSSRTPRLIRRVAVVAVLGLLAFLPTVAQAGWTNPVTVLASGHRETVGGAMVALDDAENSYVVWETRNPATDAITVWQRMRTPGGAWSEPVAALTTTGTYVSVIDVQARGNGDVVMLLRESKPRVAENALLVLRRAADGSWSKSSVTNAPVDTTSESMALNARGDVVVAWREPGGVRARFAPVGGSWGAIETVYQTSYQSAMGGDRVEIGLSDTGVVTAVWSGEGCNSGDVCQWFNSMRASATNWPRSALTPTSQNVGHAEFVHSGAGDMVFAYTVQTSSTAPRALYARFRNPGAGSWAGARLLSSGPVPNSPYVALSANGRSTILWSEWPVGGTNVVKGASRPRGTGEWVTQLHLPSQNGASFLAAGEDGSMLGIWEGTGAYAQQNVAAFQAADGTWGQAQPLPLKDLGWFTGGLIAADRAVLTADRSLPDEQRELVVTSFSAGAPAFGNVEVPASLSAGSQGTFSAVVSTWLSPSVTWDFGDGAKASGAAVSHAYASPGTYTVTITGSDGAGGTVSATRTVTVTKVAVVAPQLRKFKVKRHKIARVGSKSARAKRTRVIVKLSQKAEVRFVVKRVRKSGKARKVGAFTKRLDRGKSRFWLKAKAGKRVLKPGRYVVVARAKNGNGRSAAKRQKLIVVR